MVPGCLGGIPKRAQMAFHIVYESARKEHEVYSRFHRELINSKLYSASRPHLRKRKTLAEKRTLSLLIKKVR